MNKLIEKERELKLKEKEIKVMEKLITKLLTITIVLPIQIIAFFLIAKGYTTIALLIALLTVFLALFLLYIIIKPPKPKKR